MGHNSWRAKVEKIERLQRHDTSRELQADALDIVAKWNADLELRRRDQYGFAERRHLPQFSPTIGCAIRAGTPFLRVLCPGCRQHGDIDLRTIVRPDSFPVTGIYDALNCTRCRGGPAPELVGLFQSMDDPMAVLRDEAAERLAGHEAVLRMQKCHTECGE